jgi:hypothetical protein
LHDLAILLTNSTSSIHWKFLAFKALLWGARDRISVDVDHLFLRPMFFHQQASELLKDSKPKSSVRQDGAYAVIS